MNFLFENRKMLFAGNRDKCPIPWLYSKAEEKGAPARHRSTDLLLERLMVAQGIGQVQGLPCC